MKSRPSRLDCPLDFAPASFRRTGLAFPAIHPEPVLEIAKRAISGGKIAQGRAPDLHRFGQHRLDIGRQPPQPAFRDAARRLQG